MDSLYGSYTKFQAWTSDQVTRPENHAETMRLCGRTGRLRVLEVGFGSGDFLNWAKDQHDVSGIEIIPELVTAARAAGHTVTLSTIEAFDAPPFDLIVATDVLEHLTVEELRSFFGQMSRLLKPGGRLVARFPNGASPFGRIFQTGDLTHKTALSKSAARQLAIDAGLIFVGAFNFRPAGPLKRKAAYLLRDIIGTVVCLAFYGWREPMDANVVVVVEHPQSPAVKP